MESLTPNEQTANQNKFRVILIFDMNSFFVSVELRDYLRNSKVDLRGKPVIVGTLRRRKVVSTATPEARDCGVKKGMDSLKAARKSPQAVWLPPRPLVYEDESDEILRVVRDELATMGLNPVIGTVGLDEAYMDLTPYCQGATSADSLDMARSIAEKLKARILKERGLHCKIGIASNRMMAKIATDQKSPDGINIIYDHDWNTILPPLDVNEIPDVGEVTEQLLKSGNPSFKTIADIRNSPPGFDFTTYVGKQKFLAPILRDLAFGNDERVVKADGPPKSFSRIETFEYDTKDMKVIGPEICYFGSDLQTRLNKFKKLAGTVKVYYVHAANYEDRKKRSVQKKLDVPTDHGGVIMGKAMDLVAEHDLLRRELYSLGVAVDNLVDVGTPLPPPKPKKPLTAPKPKQSKRARIEEQTVPLFKLP